MQAVKILIIVLVLITLLIWSAPSALALDDLWIVQAVAGYDVYPQLGEHWDCRVVSVAFDASEPGWGTIMYCERLDNHIYLPLVMAE